MGVVAMSQLEPFSFHVPLGWWTSRICIAREDFRIGYAQRENGAPGLDGAVINRTFMVSDITSREQLPEVCVMNVGIERRASRFNKADIAGAEARGLEARITSFAFPSLRVIYGNNFFVSHLPCPLMVVSFRHSVGRRLWPAVGLYPALAPDGGLTTNSYFCSVTRYASGSTFARAEHEFLPSGSGGVRTTRTSSMTGIADLIALSAPLAGTRSWLCPGAYARSQRIHA